VRGRFSLVVLNTCNSLGIAQMLQEEANVGVICTLISVPDTLAYRTASRLASALVDAPNVAAAYLSSKPGRNREYLYLPALAAAQSSIDNVLLELRKMAEGVNEDSARSTAVINLLWRVVWLNAAFHVAEWAVIVWLWLQVKGI
jgi:hypothetical protein